MSLAGLLVESAARSPQAPALAFEGERIAYAELERRVARAAGALRARGVEAGDRVPLVLPTTPTAVVALHGALRIGAVAAPLNPLLSRAELEARQRVLGARALTADELGDGEEAAVANVGEARAAVILFTSGTTGEPKPVELTHAGLRQGAEYLAREGLRLQAADVLFGAAPLAHVFGLTACVNASIAAGSCLALLRRFDGAAALDLIERERVSVFLGVPTMCSALLAAASESGRTPSFRLAHVGGAPLDPGLRAAFCERFGSELLEGYGMTEAGGVVALEHAGEVHVPGSVGRPAAGALLGIADDGEVLLAGPTLARDLEVPFATGDIGRFDAAGNLFLIDRKKNLILRGGYSVSPQELESLLRTHADVRDALVVGIPHPELGEEVGALVVPASSRCDVEDVKLFARERIAAYKYPRVVELVADLPVGPTGKPDRRAARQLLAPRRKEV